MFFSAIKLSQADEMVAEQARMKTHLGFMSIDPDTTELLDCTKIPDKLIQGTPWYSITSNVDYATRFNYTQAGVSEREKLIEDGYDKINDEDGELDEDRKELLFEQSDMVMVLLNLSYIPDEVIKEMDFNRGWSKRFLALMKKYQEDFTAEHGIEWDFQNEEIEQDYLAFKNE